MQNKINNNTVTRLQHSSVVSFVFIKYASEQPDLLAQCSCPLKTSAKSGGRGRAPGNAFNICFTLMIGGAASFCNFH